MNEKDMKLQESHEFLLWTDEQQKEPDSYWKKFLDAIEDPVFIISTDGRILLFNSALEKFLNLNPEDIAGKKCYALIHGLNRFTDGCPFIKSRKTGKRESYVLNISGKWYRMSVDPIYDKEGKFTGAVHIINNVDELLKTSAERSFLGKVIENTEDAIISTDTTGKITAWNNGSERMFGYTKEEMLEKDFSGLLNESSDIKINEIIDNFNKNGYDRQGPSNSISEKNGSSFRIKHQNKRRDTEFRTKSGELLDVSLGVSPVYDERDELNGVAFILTNHTGQRKAEQNLLSFMAETILRLEKPLEMIKSNLKDIIDLYENGDIEREDLYDLLSIQISNAEKILENIADLKAASSDMKETIPDVMRDFLRQ